MLKGIKPEEMNQKQLDDGMGNTLVSVDELLRLGAIYGRVHNWEPFSVVDGRLTTGRNPASSTSAAQALLKYLLPRQLLKPSPRRNSISPFHPLRASLATHPGRILLPGNQ
jgi:hypothetical protein